MKPSIWDILTGVVLLAILCLAGSFTLIFFNPSVAFNPFPPPTSVPQVVISIPTATQTVAMLSLPPTWTMTPTTQPSTATAPMVLKPSSTIPPTATMYFASTGTATPRPTQTPGGPTPANLRCYIEDLTYPDNTEVSAGQEFDKRWNIRNNSGETWRADILDIRYLSGQDMHIGADAYDLPRNINSGESFEVSVRMRAPSSPGTYKETWGITTGTNTVCNFTVQIIIK